MVWLTEKQMFTSSTLCWESRDSATDPYSLSLSSPCSSFGLYLVPVFETLKDTPIVPLLCLTSLRNFLKHLGLQGSKTKQGAKNSTGLWNSPRGKLCPSSQGNCPGTLWWGFCEWSPWFYRLANLAMKPTT